MRCIQSAECDKETKISVTQSNDNELQCVGILLTLITLVTLKAVRCLCIKVFTIPKSFQRELCVCVSKSSQLIKTSTLSCGQVR